MYIVKKPFKLTFFDTVNAKKEKTFEKGTQIDSFTRKGSMLIITVGSVKENFLDNLEIENYISELSEKKRKHLKTFVYHDLEEFNKHLARVDSSKIFSISEVYKPNCESYDYFIIEEIQ